MAPAGGAPAGASASGQRQKNQIQRSARAVVCLRMCTFLLIGVAMM